MHCSGQCSAGVSTTPVNETLCEFIADEGNKGNQSMQLTPLKSLFVLLKFKQVNLVTVESHLAIYLIFGPLHFHGPLFSCPAYSICVGGGKVMSLATCQLLKALLQMAAYIEP